MLKQAGLTLAAFMILATILSGCSLSGNTDQKNASATVKTQAQTSANQAAASTTDSVAKKTDVNGSNTSSTTAEKPVAPEKNPPGDIPDTQVFVKYVSSSGGYELQVPEGWARTENGTDVKFADKFDGLQVKVQNVTGQVTVDSIKKIQVADLAKTGRAVTVKSVKETKLSGIQAFIVSYDSNSDPDSVTNKQIRLENQNFYFYKGGKMAVVTVWAPLGADNVDQWNYISNNFKWR